MNKLVFTALLLASIGQAMAATCRSPNDMKGTWTYYNGANYGPSATGTAPVLNISQCVAAFTPTDATSGTMAGYCWISPGKGPKTQVTQGQYTVLDPATCYVQVLVDMGAMGISTNTFNLSSSKDTWIGMWTNAGGNWGTSSAIKTLKTNTITPTPSLQNQSITWGTAPSLTKGGTGTVTATSPSGLPVVIKSTTPSLCTAAAGSAATGITVTGVAPGACILEATQPGNSNWNPATPVQQTITVK